MQNIQYLISTTIKSLYNVNFTPEISPAPKPELGEYCIGVFQLAKPLGKAPNQIAAELATELAKHTETFTSTNSIGGYVNFFLTDNVWLSLFDNIQGNGGSGGRHCLSDDESNNKDEQGEKERVGLSPDGFGTFATKSTEIGIGKTIVVDYIGANVGKPLHIGHICTPSIGQTICNVYRHLGYRVIGDSHFGDWGGIFGKLIFGWKEYAKLEGEEQNFIQLNQYGVQYLLDIYQWIHNQTGNASISEEAKIQAEEVEKNCRIEFQYLSGVGIDLSNPEEKKHHEENVELWKKFTSISIAETEKKLQLLNVHADYNIGESFYEGLNLPRPNDEKYPDLKDNMKSIVAELIKKGIATQNEDGSVGVVFPEEAKMPSCILQKKDGTGLYLTSDLAAIKYRLTNGWNPSKIIYSVDVRQQLHLKQAFWIARAAWGQNPIGNSQKQEIQGSEDFSKGVYSDVNEQEKSDTDEEVRSFSGFPEFFHAFNGFIKLKEGAMSTRHGTVIFLEALITEGFERTKKILEEKGRDLADADIQAITIAAIKYSYLAQDREKDVVFDWDKALNFEGNSGPYIQYAFVRAKKIVPSGFNSSPSSTSLKLSEYDKSLIQSLARFDEAVIKTAETYKPHHLALYAYELAVIFNGFYVHTPKILEEQDENLKNFRLSLVVKTAETLEKAFDLLGIKMPSEM